MPLTIDVTDLLRWSDATAAHWRDLLRAHPAVLNLPCDIRNSGDVAHFLQHIVAVELRYAQRLASEPESPYEAVPFSTPDEIFATHDQAFAKLNAVLADEGYNWSQEFDFQTITMGRLRATRRDILLHLLLHSMRHYAQLATLVRAAGIKPGWPMDFLFLNAVPTV